MHNCSTKIFGCGVPGHALAFCPTEKNATCGVCQKKGHSTGQHRGSSGNASWRKKRDEPPKQGGQRASTSSSTSSEKRGIAVTPSKEVKFLRRMPLPTETPESDMQGGEVISFLP